MQFRLILAASVTLAAAGCNSEVTADAGTGGGAGGGAGGGTSGFQQPDGSVAVNFTVDDTANKAFTAHDGGASDLLWKGGFELVSAQTRLIIADSAWNGPHPPLYDDGPWTSGGHEPRTNVAADNKWGVTVFIMPPATGSATYEYGLKDGLFPGQDEGWIWRGSNGTFTVGAGATGEITAAGIALLPFGTRDLKISVNTTALIARPALPDGGTASWDTSEVYVKGSGWAWRDSRMYDDGTHGDVTSGDHVFTFLMSKAVGPGTDLPHSGLLSSGDTLQFVITLGPAKTEYRGLSDPSSEGVKAYVGLADGGLEEVTLTNNNADKNPTVTVP